MLSVVVASSRSSKQSLSLYRCLTYLQHRRERRLGRTCWRCHPLQSEELRAWDLFFQLSCITLGITLGTDNGLCEGSKCCRLVVTLLCQRVTWKNRPFIDAEGGKA